MKIEDLEMLDRLLPFNSLWRVDKLYCHEDSDFYEIELSFSNLEISLDINSAMRVVSIWTNMTPSVVEDNSLIGNSIKNILTSTGLNPITAILRKVLSPNENDKYWNAVAVRNFYTLSDANLLLQLFKETGGICLSFKNSQMCAETKDFFPGLRTVEVL